MTQMNEQEIKALQIALNHNLVDAQRYRTLRDHAVDFQFEDGRKSAWIVIGTDHKDACPTFMGNEIDDTVDAMIAVLRDEGEIELYSTLQSPAVQVPDGWKDISTAPTGKNGIAFMRLAWGPDEDKATGDGMRIGDKFYAIAAFHSINSPEKAYEFRELEVQPTHYMTNKPFASAPQPPWQVTDGWQLVPVEPTEEMLSAGFAKAKRTTYGIYEAMLAAAPQPVSQAGDDNNLGEENVRLDMDSDNSGAGQQREMVREISLGQPVGDWQDQSGSHIQTQAEHNAVLRLDGIDEYGPILGWFKDWTKFPIGTRFYTATAKPVSQAVDESPTESVLIDGTAYTVPEQVAAELLSLHLQLRGGVFHPSAPVGGAVAWRVRRIHRTTDTKFGWAVFDQPHEIERLKRDYAGENSPYVLEIEELGVITHPSPTDGELVKDAIRYRWLRDRNDWHTEPRIDEKDGTIWNLTFYTAALIIDQTDDENLDSAIDAARTSREGK